MEKIKRRGAPPEGGGEVVLQCPVVRALKPLLLEDPGKIRRIRGVAYCSRTSPQFANRLVHSARGVLNQFVSDIFISTDHRKGVAGGK